MKKEFLLTITLLIPIYTVSAIDGQEILLKSRHFIPERGITSAAKSKIESNPGKAHILIQLERKPTIEDINLLESKGVKLLSYIPKNTWIASIPSNKTDEITGLSNVRSIVEILPKDKISPHIKTGNIFKPRVKDGKTAFIVEFFEDVSSAEIESTLERHNGIITGWVPNLNAVVAVMRIEESIDSALEEGVKWIEQELPLGPTNNGTRAAIGVDAVQTAPYNLTGSGVNVLVYDVGLVYNNHSDLVNRVIFWETGYINSHSTHVAGTIGGDGTLSNGLYRGMAPAVNIISYYYACCDDDPCTFYYLYDDLVSIADMDANFNEGITTYGADIITASLGFQPALWKKYYDPNISCDYEGDYSAYAQRIDGIIQNNSIPITWAAANERGYQSCGTTYNTISPTATAKNAIVVGATNSNDNSMTGFSSWGPTDDGRIKPDVVAPGCENDPCGFGDPNDPNKSIWSTWPYQSYYGYCGTSMATPAVAGSIALMLERWRNIFGQPDPKPATIKAILINTAFDLGNTGPDYSFGYGRIDVNAAINLIDSNTIREIYSDYPVDFNIYVPPDKPELKITLVWDDAPGAPNADQALVNDINLIVTDPEGNRHYPWILDPYNPENPATRGEDHLNNVEQVCVDNPLSGTWTIDVNGDIEDIYGGQHYFSVVWGCPEFFNISKEDDVPDGNSVLPGDTITYTIQYSYPREHNKGDLNNMSIVDYLTEEIEPNDPCDPNYDAETRTYIWNIGALSPDGNGTISFTARVNNLAEPLGTIINRCSISNNGIRPDFATEITDVNAWNPPVIYVDINATGKNNGMSWTNAYKYLQNALDKATIGCGAEIWVAKGTYIPSVEDPYYGLTFKLINGISLYGHFAGNETSIYQRNFTNSANETILSGEGISLWYLVTASDFNQNTNLDGFTITGNSILIEIENAVAELTVKNCLLLGRTSQSGINAVDDSDLTVANCTIQDFNGNEGRGISVADSNFTITCCDINNNGFGIYVWSAIAGSQITNNIIHNNITVGISVYNSDSLLVANNWIHHNIFDGIYTQCLNITYRNNTIVSNGHYGIYDDGTTSGPTIHNCIIWNNAQDLKNTGSADWYHATYSCFTNYDIAVRGTGNIYGDANDANNPRFVDANSNYHLDPNSPCIDTGDPCFNDYSQTDIDGEPRISNSRVDMGADEYYWPKADYDRDGIVNFIDFSFLAADWLDSNSIRSLDIDTDVDMDDLSLFCKDWLWIAPWSPLYQSIGLGGMGMMTESSSESFVLSEEMPAVMEEPSESNDGPMSDEQIQDLIDWTEQLWESNPELMEMAGQDGYDLIMESLTEQLTE